MTKKDLPVKVEWRTFDEWSRCGYSINKGSKATWFDGVAKFSREQVTEKSLYKNCTKTSRRFYNNKGYSDYQDHDELAEAYGAYASFWDHL